MIVLLKSILKPFSEQKAKMIELIIHQRTLGSLYTKRTILENLEMCERCDKVEYVI
jgi:hypothetical protein